MPSPTRYNDDQFPPDAMNWAELVPLIGAANAGLGRYDELQQVQAVANLEGRQ